MKSILQLDRETQLDRQRRLLFCWCYTEAAKTFQPSECGYRHDRFQMLYETLRIFLFRTVEKRWKQCRFDIRLTYWQH